MSDNPVFRPGGVSYLRIPSDDIARSAAFYAAVFGWELSGDAENPSFADGGGQVIGHWRADLAVVGEAGVVPYVYVDDIDATIERIGAQGGAVVEDPYREGGLWVATFRDPAGNVLGVWQSGERAQSST